MGYRSYYLAKEFTELGHDIYIFSASYSHSLINLPEIKRSVSFEKIDNINYNWIKVPRYSKSKSIGRALSMIIFIVKLFLISVKNITKPDVLIVSSPSPFPILNAYLWAKKFNAKLIFEVRDLWPLTLIELGNFSKYNPFIIFMRLFEHFAYKHSDYVVSVLPRADEYMITHGMDRNKFFYIPNGIDLNEIDNSEPLDEKVIRKIPRDLFIIGYAGAVGIANALEYLINAAHILKNNKGIFFVIVGNGGEKERLINMSRGLNNLLFLGAVRKSQVQNILKFFDVCYISLKKIRLFRFGVSPNKLFDYMYAGKPIIYAVNSGNNPVKDANCGISIEAENTNALVDAILKLFTMSKKQKELLGKNGKNYVIKHHTYENLAKKYFELFTI